MARFRLISKRRKGRVCADFGLRFIGLGEAALEDRDRHAQKDRIAEKTEGPDPETHQCFIQ